MKKIKISDQQEIAYFFDGPTHHTPLVLLHGFCEDASVWDPILPYLQDVPVLRLNLPGFGESSMPDSIRMEDYAHAILSAVTLLGHQRCVLVGHSLGGYVALEYLRHHPEHLVGMGLFHSHPFPDDDEKKNNRRRGIETLQQGKRDLYVTQLFPGLFTPAFVKEHPEVIATLTEAGKQHESGGIIAALEAMIARPDHSVTLKNAEYPVLFILGEEDKLVPLEETLQAATWPVMSDIHVLPGVAHMGMWESTEESAEALKKFWEYCLER